MDHLKLRDVLAQESLGLRLVTKAKPQALDREVLGAHGTEAPHPVPWLQRDWILLVTGVRLVSQPQRQRELVRELAAGELAALGFGVGIDFDTVPEALVEEAERLDFAVFEIPLATPFREIIAYVNRSLLSADLHVMRRLTSMREFLIDAMGEQDPQPIIVQRLASLLDSDVALFTADGRVEAASGGVDTETLWRFVQRGQKDGEASDDRRTILSATVADRQLPSSWLAVAVSRRGPAETYGRPLIQTAAMLLSALVGVRRVTRSMRRAGQAAFMRDLIEAEQVTDSATEQRAAALGLDLSSPARGVVLSPPVEQGELLERVQDQAELVLEAAGVPVVLSATDGRIAGFVQGPEDAIGEALEALIGSFGELAIGVGRPATSISRLHGSLRDAALALEPRPSAAPTAGLHRFEDFDLLTWLLAGADADALRVKAEGVLGALRRDETLSSTLKSFLDHRLKVPETARSLSLHPNSLRYRLARIEELLGRELDDPDALAEIEVARRVLAEPCGLSFR